MSALLLASQCPAVQVPTVTLLVANAGGSVGNALVAKNVPASVDWRTLAANPNATMLDLISRYGAGVIGMPDGPNKISISAPGSGLLLNVSAGHSMVGGPVENAAATTVTCADATRNFIWHRSTGSLVATPNTTPPSGESCFIGSALASGGNIVSVDTSGVVLLRGGIGWRQTADAGIPSDSPPSAAILITQTLASAWLWDGSQWQQLGGTALRDTIADATSGFVGDGMQESLFDSLTVYGTFQDYGKVRII